MASVLEVLSLHEAIPLFKEKALEGKEVEMADAIFDFLDGRTEHVAGITLDQKDAQSARRRWKLRAEDQQRLLKDVLPRFALGSEQIEKILAENRTQNGIFSPLSAIAENPYALTEQYDGDDPDDSIPWGTIDRGMIPSPELGGEMHADLDDARRFRALVVDALRREET